MWIMWTWGILTMHAEGRGATEIAEALGCSQGAVYKVLAAQAVAL